MRLIATVLIAFAAVAAQAGEVYKWVDKDGKVHYGDRPKHEAQQVEIRGASEDGTETAQAPANEAECQRKRAQLETYKKASAIRETDNLGRVREYTGAEREQLLALTEKQANEACAPAQ